MFEVRPYYSVTLLEIYNKNTIYFLSVNTKYVSSNVLRISTFSLVIQTRENTDIFISFDEMHLVFTSKELISSIYQCNNSFKTLLTCIEILRFTHSFISRKKCNRNKKQLSYEFRISK